MAITLIELHRGVSPHTRYVLRCETLQHQITRTPTILTIPGEKATGEPRVIGYDLGVVTEQITMNGQITTQDEVVVEGDPAYEVDVSKTYPGKESLRSAVLKWWADATWGTLPTGLCRILTPLGETYLGIIQSCQFTLEPGRDIYDFALVFRVAYYPEA